MGGASSTISTNTFILDSGEVYLTKDETNDIAGESFDENTWESFSKDLHGRVAFSDLIDECRIVSPSSEAALLEQREKIQWLARISSPGSSGALGSAPTKLLGDRDIILAAIANNPRALEYASPELKNCKDVVLAAAKQSGACLTFASRGLMKDKVFLSEVRQTLADQYEDLPSGEKEQMELASHGIDGYRYYGSLNAALINGAVLLVRASYLISISEAGKRLEPRSELPPDAFYGGPIWEGGGRGVIVVAVSYMHQTAEHPDPDAVHLNDVVTFLHFLRRSRDGYEICVYWDWASTFLQIPSKPPLDSVQPLSIAARDQVAFWFTHPNILTLQNKVTPPARQKGWDMSAWPLFEECLSMLLKKQENIVDLQTFLAWRRSESVEEWRKSDYSQFSAACTSGPRILPLAPMSFRQQIGDGSNKNERHLAGGLVDAELLRAQYKEMIAKTTKKIEILRLNNMGASSAAWYNPLVIAGVRVGFVSSFLELCSSLVTLDLSRNKELVMSIVDLLRTCPATLKSLQLSITGVHGDGTKAPWDRVPNLSLMDLQGTKIKGTKVELEGAFMATARSESKGFEGGLKKGERGGDGFGVAVKKCAVWPGMDAEEINFQESTLDAKELNYFVFEVMPSCKRLETLILSNNPALKEDIVSIVNALPASIKRIYLSNTSVFGKAPSPEMGKLKKLCVLDLRRTQVVTGSVEEFESVLATGQKCALVL
jgi:hypothetical protein